MPRIRTLALAAGAVAALLIVPVGCSSSTTAPETIEGKSPADYREEMESNVAGAVPKTPGKAPKAKRR